jgi:hypothetical protein
MPITYFYALADGKIKENRDNLPADSVGAINRQDGLVLRVAYDSDANRVHIQDGFFRRLLGDGDRLAWHYLNEMLLFLRKNSGAKFPERAYGDPPNTSQVRMFSQYRKAWKRVRKYLDGEFGMSPPDVKVCEYVPKPGFEGETVSFSATGTACGGQQLQGASISVNRFAGASNGDADFREVNRLVGDAYLDRMDEIMAQFPQLGFRDRLARHKDAGGGEIMFATVDGQGNAAIHRTRGSEHPDVRDEEAIRRLNAMRDYDGPIVVFQVVAPRQVVLLNFSSLEMSRDQKLKAMLGEILSAAARMTGVNQEGLVVTFEPSLSLPFVTRIGRYEALRDFIRSCVKDEPEDIAVLEVPLPVYGTAAAIPDSEAENRLCPDCQRYRAIRGIEVQYPFVVVDARGAPLGMRLAAMARAYCGLAGKEMPEFHADDVRSLERRSRIASSMAYMFAMGLGKKDAVDFFASRGAHRDRAAMWEVADEAWSDPRKASSDRKEAEAGSSGRQVKTAEFGPGIGINDWWYLGLQETMLRSKHTWGKPGTEAYNLKDDKKKAKGKAKAPVVYDELLDPLRDKQMSAQKTTEQLLRESRV